VAPPADPHDDKFEEVSDRLDESLRSCRAVVSSYRALLAGDGHEEPGHAGFTEASAADEETPLRI
jgi:hypothetical protein